MSALPLDLRRKVRIHHEHTETEWGCHDPVEHLEWNPTLTRHVRVTEYRSKVGARGIGYTLWVKWTCIDTACGFEAWVSTRAIEDVVESWLSEAGQ